jgi:hypothetical protein
VSDNSTLPATNDVIRDKDRAGTKTQIVGRDLNIGGATEVLETASAAADAFSNPTAPVYGAFLSLFNGATWDRARGDTTNGLDVDVTRLPALAAGTNNIGDVDVLTVPADPFGLNADAIVAAGAAGSIQAKLRRATQGLEDLKSLIVLAAGTNNIGDVDVLTLPALPAGTNNIGDVDVLTVPADPFGANADAIVAAGAAGSIQAKLRRVTQGLEDLKTLIVLGAGTNTIGGVLASGDVDHDAVNTGKVVQIGGHASPLDTPPTLVSAAGDRVRAWFDRAGAHVVRRRKLRETYTAYYRLAETTARLDLNFTQVANATKQWATLHHAATATRDVRVQKAVLYLLNVSAATQLIIELRRITTAPATGNPAITPIAHHQGAAATECTALALPTTGATITADSLYGGIALDLGITGTASVVNPPPVPQEIVLYDASRDDDEVYQPILRNGILEGVAIIVRAVGTPVVRATAMIRYTEEAP